MPEKESESAVRRPNALDRLITLFSKLPGIGKKSAGRIAYHILDNNPALAQTLANELAGLHQAIRHVVPAAALPKAILVLSVPTPDAIILLSAL